MATFTKLYLHTGTAPYTPATIRGTWDDTAGAVTRALDPYKTGGGNITTVARAEAVSTDPYRVLLFRGVSGPLTAQTISGTLDVVLGILEANADADFHWMLHVYVTQGDSDTLRGTLLSNYTEALGTNEWPTTGTGKGLNSAQALASLAVSAGDRLVVEIGYVSRNTHTTSRSGTLRYGTLDASVEAADLTIGSTSVSSLAGYLTFSSAIEQDITTRATQAGVESIVTTSTPAVRATQAGVEVLYQLAIAGRYTQAGFEVIYIPGPPLGGGIVGTGVNPAVGDSVCGAVNVLPFVIWRMN